MDIEITKMRLGALIKVAREIGERDGVFNGKEYNPTKTWNEIEFGLVGLLIFIDSNIADEGRFGHTWDVDPMNRMVWFDADGLAHYVREMTSADLMDRVAEWFGIPVVDAYRLFGFGMWPSGYFVPRGPWNAIRIDIRLRPMNLMLVAENLECYVQWLVRENTFNEGKKSNGGMDVTQRLFYELNPLSLQ